MRFDAMMIEIERKKEGYLIRKNVDDFPNLENNYIEMECDNIKSLVSQLFIFCEGRHVNVLVDFQT
jgi:hypothetical protein